ncbi:MAG: CHAD domain-containing protein [Dehalococcoidia bacterium]|nr:MAG: CHAD domain-containing protein [bacterium]MCE7928544.1 CHAD domain-containing protein [Chloroflexi bacterium CFX7]MCK6563421.1 CHAD domain-containing protein [Dehalococcoidia bacterium]MCL4231659.1 CHAD domain-containing protein [Dehalococcoidia bacterium]NUQ54906.1 CHAD domain-containing protein [Dehalococcoidia bacterium]
MAEAAGSEQTEIEWQFAALDVRPVARWLETANVPGYRVISGPEKLLRDSYLDTEDWRIHRAGFTCRVREKDSGPELTLKSMADPSAGIRTRREVTGQPPPGGDLLEATGVCGELLRAAAGKRPLREVFRLETRRRVFQLHDAEGEVAEIALDETSIPVGEDGPVRLSRVEVEVSGGTVERAQRFVGVMVAMAALTAAGPSKFEAALIATGQAPAPRTPDLGPTEVRPEMSAGEVGFAVMRRHFGVFLANEAGTRLGEDIEALHDMRVAARRLRAAMAAFRPFLPPALERVRLELGRVAAALGVVRDLDVQLERMAEWREGFSAEEGHALDAIEGLLTRRRVAGRQRMLAALDSRRYENFVVRFAAMLRRGPPRTFAPGKVSILAAAPDLLEKRYRRVRKLGDAITRSSPASDYHTLRIDAKKLRYALEFVGPIYGKPATGFSQRVTALQDVLGLHQDAEIAVTMLDEMARSEWRRLGPETVLAMGSIAERYRRHAAELRGQFPGVYRPMRGREWRRLREVIEGRRPKSGIEAVAPMPRARRGATPTPQPGGQ